METGFRLGHWVVWPQRDLIEGQGDTIHIKPKSMAVLECLARAQGEVVPRNDILDAVWPGADVTDDVLIHSVTELRKAFGDSAQDSGVIETIPKKGLRLMLDVSWNEESASLPGEHQTRASARIRTGPVLVVLIIAILVAWFYDYERTTALQKRVTGSGKSIAVLPFIDMSAAQDQQHLVEGLAEELALRLSWLEGLHVVGPRSALILTGGDDARAAVSELSADFVLDGSVRRSGDDLRIVANLVDTRDGVQLWAHTFNREFSGVFEIQDRIADAVALALSVELDVGQARVNIWATKNPDAYEEVLRGDQLFDFIPEHMEQAARHYTRATVLDPLYVAAWQKLAGINNITVTDSMTPEQLEQRRIAESAIARALALAPESDYVLLEASGIQFAAKNWIDAKRYYDLAMEKDALRVEDAYTYAKAPQVHLNMLYKLGHVEAQIRLLEDAYRLRPYGGAFATFLPQAYLAAGRIEQALTEVERAYANPWARFVISHVGLSIALTIDDTELIDLWLTRILEHGPAKPASILIKMYDLLGDRDASLEWLRDYDSSEFWTDYYVLLWASYYGDGELALEAMRRSPDLWSFWIPLHAHLRETGEFKEIVQDMGLVDYWREHGWNDFCQPVGDDDFECR